MRKVGSFRYASDKVARRLGLGSLTPYLAEKNNTAYVQAGGGIVADSVPENEYQESLNKAQALLAAIDQAEAAQYAFTHPVSP